VEDQAVARPCDRLEDDGHPVLRLPVDGYGRISADDALDTVNGNTALVTVMLANNETGTLMPIQRLSDIAHDAGTLIHTDAAQAVGKIPLRVDELGVDFLSIAGHKLYAPKGVGALYIRRGSGIQPFTLGASHERGLRPGTDKDTALGAVRLSLGRGTTLEQVEAAARALVRAWKGR